MGSSNFGPKTTADEAASVFANEIAGKTVIITGPSIGGIGYETARVLAKSGAGLVILAGRSNAKLDEAEAELKKESPDAKLRKLVIDLASLTSVRKAAAEVNEYHEPIDVLINNAAISCVHSPHVLRSDLLKVFPPPSVAGPYALTEDGIESQFGSNHIGHFLFTNLIRPRLSASSKPRVVNVSSWGHRLSDIRWDDVGFSKGEKYDKWEAYGQAKTANVLFSVALAEKWGVEAFSLHPGGESLSPSTFVVTFLADNGLPFPTQAIFTNLLRFMTVEDQQERGFLDENGERTYDPKYTWKTIEQGASTTVVAAFDPSLAGHSGSYLEDAKIGTPLPYALDKVILPCYRILESGTHASFSSTGECKETLDSERESINIIKAARYDEAEAIRTSHEIRKRLQFSLVNVAKAAWSSRHSTNSTTGQDWPFQDAQHFARSLMMDHRLVRAAWKRLQRQRADLDASSGSDLVELDDDVALFSELGTSVEELPRTFGSVAMSSGASSSTGSTSTYCSQSGSITEDTLSERQAILMRWGTYEDARLARRLQEAFETKLRVSPNLRHGLGRLLSTFPSTASGLEDFQDITPFTSPPATLPSLIGFLDSCPWFTPVEVEIVASKIALVAINIGNREELAFAATPPPSSLIPLSPSYRNLYPPSASLSFFHCPSPPTPPASDKSIPPPSPLSVKWFQLFASMSVGNDISRIRPGAFPRFVEQMEQEGVAPDTYLLMSKARRSDYLRSLRVDGGFVYIFEGILMAAFEKSGKVMLTFHMNPEGNVIRERRIIYESQVFPRPLGVAPVSVSLQPHPTMEELSPTLVGVGPDILLRIADILHPKIGDSHLFPQHQHKRPTADVLALGSVCKVIRNTLAPALFCCITFGLEGTNEEVRGIGDVSTWDHYLAHVKLVVLFNFLPAAIPAVARCVSKMKSLQSFTHITAAPIPTLILNALKTCATIDALRLVTFSVDTLQSLLDFQPIKSIYINLGLGIRQAQARPDLFSHAPLTFGNPERRRNGEPPSTEEWKNAIVTRLAQFLFNSRNQLQHIHFDWCPEIEWLSDLVLELKRLGESFTSFPALQRIRLASPGSGSGTSHELKMFLNMAPNIDQLCFEGGFKGRLVVPAEMQTLTSLHISVNESCDPTAALRECFKSSSIVELELNEMPPRRLRAIFAPRLRGDFVTKLLLSVVGETEFKLDHLRLILGSCPSLRHLKILALSCGWNVAMVDVIKALSKGARDLVYLELDHPWEKGAEGQQPPFVYPDGRTLRSDRYGNFQILAVVHGSVKAEIVHRIQEDIDAATPLYTKRFSELAKVCPRLERVIWRATDEVDWVFDFFRTPGEQIKVCQKARVIYEGDISEQAPCANSVLGRMRLERESIV
ncbi:hypothetical protein P7C70_g3740, partial [Phenoliferia sp. Uapishka_3]